MRLLKFYGRTMDGVLFRVKRELGEDALIVETKSIAKGSALARLHPGAKLEITAAVESPQASAYDFEPRGEEDSAPRPTMTDLVQVAGFPPRRKLRASRASRAARAMRRTPAQSPAQSPARNDASPATPVAHVLSASQPGKNGSESEKPGRGYGALAKSPVLKAEHSSSTTESGRPEAGVIPKAAGYSRPGTASLAKPTPRIVATAAMGSNGHKSGLLEDLGHLKAQVRGLVELGGPECDVRSQPDLADYQHLINQGVDPGLLAHPFRRWLDWRMGTAGSAVGCTPIFDPDDVMRGDGFREWFWNEWHHQLAFVRDLKLGKPTPKGPEIMGIVGGSGVGKSTTLAKLASKSRLSDRQKTAIVTLDNFRVGANQQWKQYAQLMDLALFEPVNLEDAKKCISLFDRFDWIGIDAPGNLSPDNEAGRMYGFFLAHFPQMKTNLVIDATSRDSANREQISRMTPFKPDRLIFTKLDQSTQRGGMVNLTFEEPWQLEYASAGQRVPEDLEEATPEALWRWVCADETTEAGSISPLAGAAS